MQNKWDVASQISKFWKNPCENKKIVIYNLKTLESSLYFTKSDTLG